jgi:hypothetical protein
MKLAFGFTSAVMMLTRNDLRVDAIGTPGRWMWTSDGTTRSRLMAAARS